VPMSGKWPDGKGTGVQTSLYNREAGVFNGSGTERNPPRALPCQLTFTHT